MACGQGEAQSRTEKQGKVSVAGKYDGRERMAGDEFREVG